MSLETRKIAVSETITTNDLLYITTILLNIWKFSVILNNLRQNVALYNSYPPSSIHRKNIIFGIENVKFAVIKSVISRFSFPENGNSITNITS